MPARGSERLLIPLAQGFSDFVPKTPTPEKLEKNEYFANPVDIRTLGAPLGPQKPLFFRARNFEKLAFSPKGQIVKKLYVFTAAHRETTFGDTRAHLGDPKC